MVFNLTCIANYSNLDVQIINEESSSDNVTIPKVPLTAGFLDCNIKTNHALWVPYKSTGKRMIIRITSADGKSGVDHFVVDDNYKIVYDGKPILGANGGEFLVKITKGDNPAEIQCRFALFASGQYKNANKTNIENMSLIDTQAYFA
ncbi:hypothetical protein PPL_06261 [Heterostelium album PN500]|uniref:Uncharacterized protein n=1 Tax=Heterostelium pallidum (strain ATCC 26659 / Pp 5 / PN500) TaxID=670386 RepID=D3BCN5_HETP5|nr:hypothetical protein PPL_06261 [Heterostelium album PN500]EFA80677.1 hypothetical protein PPL_06261 [Heterostelium album PN500]|eukprot:XP_020432797.1 hypothetical protein PPL_06261 [Heterostelium album PN500]